MFPKKLKINDSFKEKLNLINKTKINPMSKSESIIKSKPKLKFKISNDNTPFMPTNPLYENKKKIKDKEFEEIKDKKSGTEFKKLVLKEVGEGEMMWDSFDDSIKKIVLSEIVEKYYLYKRWKFSSVSFLFGFFFALMLLMLYKVIN